MFALLLWREARGENVMTKRVVAWSVKNRVLRPNYWDWGADWVGVMSKPEQYSSMTHLGDLNTVKYPAANDTAWMACIDLATEVYNASPGFDAAAGATHYYDRSLDIKPPEWAAKMVHVLDSGAFHFFKPSSVVAFPSVRA